MFRYYFDTNIYKLLTPSHPGHRDDLKQMLEEFRNELLVFYSDAHFDDLKGSKEEYWDSDLEVVHIYAKDNYFTMDLQNNLDYQFATPQEAFYSKDYAAAEQFLQNPMGLDELLGDDSDPLVSTLKDLLNSTFNLPISTFSPDISNDQLVPPEHREMLNRMIPNYSSTMSLGEFWQSSVAYSVKTFSDDNEMKTLRESIAAYTDKDQYSWDKWKGQFNIRFKETGIGKTFKELVETMLLDSQKQNLWLRITYLYSLLEMYGVTEERVGGKKKKNSMSGLIKDANHVYYAAFTDYLVTEDKGMQLKAHIIYQLLNYSTEVLSIDELLARKSQLRHTETSDSFLAALEYDMEHNMQLYTVPDLLHGYDSFAYKSTLPYFGYFNRFLITPGYKEFDFYCVRKAPIANFIMYRELGLVTARLLKAFGNDDERKGEYQLNEKIDGDHLRLWSMERVQYKLYTYAHERKSFIMLNMVLLNHNV